MAQRTSMRELLMPDYEKDTSHLNRLDLIVKARQALWHFLCSKGMKFQETELRISRPTAEQKKSDEEARQKLLNNPKIKANIELPFDETDDRARGDSFAEFQFRDPRGRQWIAKFPRNQNGELDIRVLRFVDDQFTKI